jgi:O-methyltransferase
MQLGNVIDRVACEIAMSPRARRVRRERLTYLAAPKIVRLERTLKAVAAAGCAGEYLEFGVALGGASILIAGAARRAGRAFAGYDVFGMIPPPTSQNDDTKSLERYQVIATGQSEGLGGDLYYGYRTDLIDQVQQTFSRHGLDVDGRSISLVKGLFEDTLPSRPAAPIAFAHIDCDWYDPVRLCLEHVMPSLFPGGAVIFDDYHDYGGCKVAVDEFLEANPQVVMDDGPNVILSLRA